MAELKTNGKTKVSEKKVKLDDEIYKAVVNKNALYEAVKMYLANKRTGTAHTKTRAEIVGSTARPWKQKGTGRARAGDKKSPIWRGGGKSFGPKPRKFSYSIPKKEKKIAFVSALSAKFQEGKIKVIDDIDMKKPKTKDIVALIKKQKVDRTVLIIGNDKNSVVYKSTRNIPYADFVKSSLVNTHDILNHDNILMTKEAVSVIKNRVMGKKK